LLRNLLHEPPGHRLPLPRVPDLVGCVLKLYTDRLQ